MRKLTAEHEEFITALVPEVRGAGVCVCVFWGFLGVCLLKACQDQWGAVLVVGVGLFHCWEVWVLLPTPFALGHQPEGGQLGSRC